VSDVFPLVSAMTSSNLPLTAEKMGCPSTQYSPAWLHCLYTRLLPLETQSRKVHTDKKAH